MNARLVSRTLVIIATFVLSARLSAQDSARSRTRDFTSTRWGFRIALPADWLVEFEGPPRSGCKEGSTRQIRVRPGWIASRRIADTEEIDRIEVLFTRMPFDSLAINSGFTLADSGWARERGYGARPIWAYGTDSAAITRGNGWQAIEGFAVARVDHPHPSPGEPAFDFDNTFQSVARFESSDGCALVLSVRIISHVSSDESLAELWRSVRLTRHGG